MPFDPNSANHTEILHTLNETVMQVVTEKQVSAVPALVAQLSEPLLFREAFAVFDQVVNYDIHSKLQDRQYYDKWLRQNNKACEIIKRRTRRTQVDESDAIKKQLKAFMKENKRALLPYQKAQKRYLRYLFQRALEQEYRVNPWLSLQADELSFEVFTLSQKLYCRLSLDIAQLENLRNPVYGSAMIRYDTSFYEAIEKIRTYRQMQIKVVQGEPQPGSRLAGDFPIDYQRGVRQLNAALSPALEAIPLKIIDLVNLLTLLENKKSQNEDVALRFELTPNEPVRIVLEPEALSLECPQSIYQGTQAKVVRHWFRAELLLLKRLVSVASAWTVYLTETSYPVFYQIELGGVKLTVGLSGWQANDWSRIGIHDLLNQTHDIDDFSRLRILKQLEKNGFDTVKQLAGHLKMPEEQVAAALHAYAQEGVVYFDVDKNRYRLRPLFDKVEQVPALRFANKTEAKARYLHDHSDVRIDHQEVTAGIWQVAGTVRDKSIDFQPEIAIDRNFRLVQASCFCHQYAVNRLKKGPCEHVLALRMAAKDFGCPF